MDEKLIDKTVDLSRSQSTAPLRQGPRSAVEGGLIDRLPPPLRQSTRFEIRELLGRGGFGEVYLATDCHLSRPVALKVPRTDRLKSPADLEEFLQEARTAASLRHPGIVTVYDVHSDEDGIFIVMEFVEGCTLSKYAGREPLSVDEAVRLMSDMAHAIAYAHERGLVHRDLKMANILVDGQRKIRITDFGLAIHERGQRLLARAAAGTPLYMAPEQVRGETHRLDGRTDIWSLGVIFYWLLTGRRPFDGASEAEIFNEILHGEPRPPRQIAASVPRELERICFKCLSKRMSERYATAHDLADDLLHWSALKSREDTPSAFTPSAAAPPAAAQPGGGASGGTPAGGAPSAVMPVTPEHEPSSPAEAAVVPRGLRCFDQHDADFYLTLLPGPFDRHGLPESVRFWKQRIEEGDPQATFSAGLMYGPSGCGKTSLVRAGILPRLARHVRWVYIEAAAEETEHRLRRALARVLPSLPPSSSLVEMLVELREGEHLLRGEKLFLVIDQFEQWLNGREVDESDSLVRALRQCDGGRVQCLVMVRDDFTMAATRFMGALEVPIIQGDNCAAVDVFHREHARDVLRRFGEAFGRVSPEEGPADAAFLDQAVDLLSEGGVIAPVRLAAFAELMRHQQWNAAVLKRFGGSEGLGVALLEGCLGDEISNPMHRQHRHAARQVLSALLPEDRTSLKGPMRSEAELMEAVGNAQRPQDFKSLLDMLDKELRLISPADPQQGAWEEAGSDSDHFHRRDRYYQLAHDYLVPSLNAWLTRKQRETRRGRAQLRLEERAASWAMFRERRQMPTAWETCQILALTRRSGWTATQAAVMQRATRLHVMRLLAVFAILAALLVAGLSARDELRQIARVRDADAFADQLLVADIHHVPELLTDMESTRDLWSDQLRSAADDPATPSGEQLRANLALVPKDVSRVQEIVSSVLADDAATIGVVREVLSTHAEQAAGEAWRHALDPAREPAERLRAAALLAAYDPANEKWKTTNDDIVDALVTGELLNVDQWTALLAPAADQLIDSLTRQFHDASAGQSERVTAARILAKLGRPDLLADLLLDADAAQFPLLLQALDDKREIVVPAMEKAIVQRSEDVNEAARLAQSRRQRNAAAALLQFGQSDTVLSFLEGGADDTARTLAMLSLKDFGVSLDAFLHLESQASDPVARQAIWIAMGQGPPNHTDPRKQAIERRLQERLRAAPSQAERSAVEWLLREWGPDAEVQRRLQAMAGTQGDDWLATPRGHFLRVVDGPVEFDMGSPPDEPGREHHETQHSRRIERSFAIGVHEVTVAQFLRFQPNASYTRDVSPEEDCPISGVSWLDAVRYCRWLSEQEGVPKDQMCYPPLDQISFEMDLPADFLSRTGYRLPTEAEWEYACRGGTTTRWFFGRDDRQLPQFAWGIGTSQERTWPVGMLLPNPLGLFDIQGNVHEWCHDAWRDGPNSDAEGRPAVEPPGPDVTASQPRVFRGGAYRTSPKSFRSAQRFSYLPETSFSTLGFRIARTVRDH